MPSVTVAIPVADKQPKGRPKKTTFTLYGLRNHAPVPVPDSLQKQHDVYQSIDPNDANKQVMLDAIYSGMSIADQITYEPMFAKPEKCTPDQLWDRAKYLRTDRDYVYKAMNYVHGLAYDVLEIDRMLVWVNTTGISDEAVRLVKGFVGATKRALEAETRRPWPVLAPPRWRFSEMDLVMCCAVVYFTSDFQRFTCKDYTDMVRASRFAADGKDLESVVKQCMRESRLFRNGTTGFMTRIHSCPNFMPNVPVPTYFEIYIKKDLVPNEQLLAFWLDTIETHLANLRTHFGADISTADPSGCEIIPSCTVFTDDVRVDPYARFEAMRNNHLASWQAPQKPLRTYQRATRQDNQAFCAVKNQRKLRTGA